MTVLEEKSESALHENELFSKFLKDAELESNMPVDIAEQIAAGLRKRFENPPLSHLEASSLGVLSVSQARKLLFFPDKEDMRLYPKMLHLTSDSDHQDHPKFKVMVNGLTTFYMAHCKHLERVRAFIEAGGLMSLVGLFNHSNLHVASQAITSMLLITDESLYPWHTPPGMEQTGKVPQEDRIMWRCMFDLSKSSFILSLLKHQPDTFPGSSLLALRLLAFYTSWLRYHFTPNRVLRLSSNLLELLQSWSTRSGINEEEKELSKKLYEDFSRFPPAEAQTAPQLSSESEETTVEGGDDCPAFEVEVVKDRTQINSYQPSEAERLKELGNTAYREGLYSDAIEYYSKALDAPVHSSQLLDEAPRRAILHTNRAAAYLSRGAAGPLREGQVDGNGLLEGLDHGEEGALTRHWDAALMDAESALGMDSGYLKAYWRKAQALSKLQRYPEALQVIDLGLRTGSSLPSSISSSAAAAAKKFPVSSNFISAVCNDLKALRADICDEIIVHATAGTASTAGSTRSTSEEGRTSSGAAQNTEPEAINLAMSESTESGISNNDIASFCADDTAVACCSMTAEQLLAEAPSSGGTCDAGSAGRYDLDAMD